MHQEQNKKEALRISCALDLTLYYRLQRIAFTIVKCTHDMYSQDSLWKIYVSRELGRVHLFLLKCS